MGFFYWLGILGGNACYIVLLLALGRMMKTAGTKKTGYIILMALMLAGYIALNPFSKEIKLLGIVSGNYDAASNGVRIAIGILGAILPFVIMRAHWFLVFDLQQNQNKNREKSVFYVHYTFFYLFHLGLWNVWMVSSLFFAAAIGKNFKPSWEVIYGVLLVSYYLGGICMAVLRQETFEAEGGHFRYDSLQKTCEGAMEDIERVERTKKGFVLYVKGEELHISCAAEALEELLADKIADEEIREQVMKV